MEFNEYQKLALTTAKSTDKSDRLQLAIYTIGLSGEVGEAQEKIKKLLRQGTGLTKEEFRLELAKELGDILWYIALIAYYFDIDLEDVAKLNIEKLDDRVKRGKVFSKGDNR